MNLNNPFTKLKTDDLYIVYQVTYYYAKTKKTQFVSVRDYELLTHINRTATIDNNPILMVENPEVKKRYRHEYIFPEMVYGNNIETGKVIRFDSSKEVSSDADMTISNYSMSSRPESFYSFPTKLKDVFELGDSISVRKALNLLHELQKMRGERETITLDSNPLIAAEQLEEARIINHSIYSDKDLKTVLEKLKEISGSQSEVFNKYIMSKVADEIDQYNKNMKEYKPTFEKAEKKSNDLQLAETKPKDQLMLNLDLLYNSLLSDIKTVHYLEDLYTCTSLVDGNDKILTKNTPLAKKVQDIVNNVSSFDNKAEILSDLKSRIDAEIDKTSSSLDEIIHKKGDEQEIELVLDDADSFKKEISMLADTYGGKSKVLAPFYELKNSLNNIDDTSNKSINDINGVLFSISGLIDSLPNEQLKESTLKKYNKIKEKYVQRIDTILLKKEEIKPNDYKELELDLRKELQPLLQEISNIENKSLNQIISSDSLIIQIQNSINLVNSRKSPGSGNHSKEPITSKVNDILNLLKQNSLENDRLIINKLLITLINHKENLSDTTISDYKEYDKARRSILRSLSGIELDINAHLKNLKDYDKQNIE